MSLRHRLQAYLIALHALFLLLTLVQYHERAGLMISLELFLLLTFIGGWQLIGAALQPLAYAQRARSKLRGPHA